MNIKDFTVTIPKPNIIPRGSGIHGTTKSDNIRTRTSIIERKQINEAAAICNVSVSTFIRHCAVHVALEILKEGRENDG